MRLCAVVITYYPDKDDAINNISRYIDDVDHLIICDNTPDPDRESYRVEIPQYSDKITYTPEK